MKQPSIKVCPLYKPVYPPLPPSLCVAVEQPRHILGRRSSGGLPAQHGQPVPDADRRSFRLRKPSKDIEKSFIMNLILGFYMIPTIFLLDKMFKMFILKDPHLEY